MDINVGLYLVRHGETDWNIESKIQGRTDTELNEKGRRQAQELAAVLQEGYGIKRIFTSRQKRAVETAEIIGKHLGISPQVKEGLEEINFGKWEGYTWRQVRELFPKEYRVWHDNRRYGIPPGGESYEQLLDRLLPTLNDILSKDGRDTLNVTHSAVIMTLMSYLYDTPFEDMAKNYKTGNTQIVKIDQELFYRRYNQRQEVRQNQ